MHGERFSVSDVSDVVQVKFKAFRYTHLPPFERPGSGLQVSTGLG